MPRCRDAWHLSTGRMVQVPAVGNFYETNGVYVTHLDYLDGVHPMRLATLNTDLEMWDCDLRHYVPVPAGTTVQVTEHSLRRWVTTRCPRWTGASPPYDSRCTRQLGLDYLDEN